MITLFIHMKRRIEAIYQDKAAFTDRAFLLNLHSKAPHKTNLVANNPRLCPTME